MFECMEITTAVTKDGHIILPEDARERLGIQGGDTVDLFCFLPVDGKPEGTREFLVSRPDRDIAQMLMEDEADLFQIPQALLAEAGIPENADLDIVCQEGMILILPLEEEEEIPEELRPIFEELGFSKEQVRIILGAEGGGDGKDNL